MRMEKSRNNGTERQEGSHSRGCDNTAQDICVRVDGNAERKDSDTAVQRSAESEEKAILGKSFLEQRLLRNHTWYGRGENPAICKISRRS